MIEFELPFPEDVPDALAAMVDAAAEAGGAGLAFDVGPFDDKALTHRGAERAPRLFVSGSDEVEGAEALAAAMIGRGVAFRAV